jgi:hypothetical protein
MEVNIKSAVGDVKRRKKEFDMNKIVLRSLIVMLSLVFGLMVVGCPNEPEDDPAGGKTIAEMYQGNYWTTPIPNEPDIEISFSKSFYHFKGNEWRAWTEGDKLYYINKGKTILLGTFQDSFTFIDASGTKYKKVE